MTPFHSLSLVTAFVFLCFSSTVLFADVMEDKFKQLNSWYRKGLITEAEFERSKKDLLKNYTQLQASEAKTSSRYQAVVEEENLMAVIPFFGKVGEEYSLLYAKEGLSFIMPTRLRSIALMWNARSMILKTGKLFSPK